MSVQHPRLCVSSNRLSHPLIVALLLLAGALAQGATLPPGFVEQEIPGPWNEAVGLVFAPDGRMYVWERAGRVWIVENGVKSSTPFLDISDEVAGYRDFGMLGFALHPDFYNNGHVYVLYVVDRHHLMNFGTPNYNPASNEYFAATIGRIARYTARASDGYRSVDPASRRVLLGETRSTGFPILHESHGIGTILVGADGTLLASCGDGASYNVQDTGSSGDTYWQQGLNDGIIRPKENVGAYRSQLVDCLNGKIVRLDPETGNGVPGNPFYDPANPRAPRSRMWALGLRNPFRMTLRPGTGSHNRADAKPGALYIGDVGWGTWEDLNVCDRPAMNFGWPAYEGLQMHGGYHGANTPNQDAPNPLFGVGGCTQQYFYFRDLIKQESLLVPSWPNPCNTSQQIPASIPRFVHARPAIDWHHSQVLARTGTFENNQATVANIGAPGSPVSGSMFPGNSSTGGAWYTNSAFPPQFRNTYFHGEYGAQWIKSFSFTSNEKPTAVQNFTDNAGGVVDIEVDPTNGDLYYIAWTAFVRRVRYVPSGNQPPVAVLAADRTYGPAPLAVQFSSAGSRDPENQPLTYRWNFGDSTPVSTAANPSHTFNAPAGVPTPFMVTLVVTDSGGASATNRMVISANNTPPQVTITSPANGTRYSLSSLTTYNCAAAITDAEHNSSQLRCAWQTILHHNDHTHAEPLDTNCTTTTLISPVGCSGESYFYRVELTVTDAAGLSTTQAVLLYPDCPPVPPSINFPPQSQTVFVGANFMFFVSATGDLPLYYQWRKNDINIPGATNTSLVFAAVQFSDAADYSVVVSNSLAALTSAPPAVLTVVEPPLPPETLIALGASWSYLDDGSNQGTGWRAPGFDDTPWRRGPAQLGYSNGEENDEATLLGFGPDANNKYITYYFRHPFVATNVAAVTGLVVRLLRDDGAIGYLNGVEWFRHNMPAGTITFATRAAGTVGGADESAIYELAVDPALLAEGTNVLAVSVHQVLPTSSDISFNLALLAQRLKSTNTPPPSVAITAPANGAVFPPGADIAITASASAFGTNIALVEFFADGNSLGNDTSHPYSLTWSNVAAGGHQLVARATDAGGLSSTSAVVSIIVSNLPPLVILTAPANGAAFTTPVNISLAATATDPESSVAKVEFFAGASKLGEDTTDPYSLIWSNVAVGTYQLSAVAADSSGRTATSAPVAISVAVPEFRFTNTLVATGAVWRFLDDGSNQGTNWIALGFDDSAWEGGPAQLGYGDGDEATPVSFGPQATNKYTTTYFRRSFNLSGASAYTNLALRVLRDDGVLIYLNGTEIFRNNLAAGPISYTNFATVVVSGAADENTYLSAGANPGLLREGVNVVAAEVHQANLTSSDISFEFALVGTGPGSAPPPLLIAEALSPVQFRLWFEASASGSYAIEASSDLQSWSTVATLSAVGSRAEYIELHNGAGLRFFRARHVP